jgi:hypothetical protein
MYQVVKEGAVSFLKYFFKMPSMKIIPIAEAKIKCKNILLNQKTYQVIMK